MGSIYNLAQHVVAWLGEGHLGVGHLGVLIQLINGRDDFDFLTWAEHDGNIVEEIAGWPSMLPKGWHGDLH
jgi:hypothetical protein